MGKKQAPVRSIRLIRPPDAAGAGVLCFAIGTRQTFYAFKEIPCDIGGRAFALHRLGLGDLYHVRVGTPEECSCECMGFLAHGHCKHIQGITALISRSLI
jgi:hypothetical protein